MHARRHSSNDIQIPDDGVYASISSSGSCANRTETKGGGLVAQGNSACALSSDARLTGLTLRVVTKYSVATLFRSAQTAVHPHDICIGLPTHTNVSSLAAQLASVAALRDSLRCQHTIQQTNLATAIRQHCRSDTQSNRCILPGATSAKVGVYHCINK